jgi:micrococcal nuclease
MFKRAVLVSALGVAGYVAGVSLGAGGTAPAAAAVDEGASFRLRATVVRVIDGDTLVARVGTRSERVRLIGIDTPELPSGCFAHQAASAAKRYAPSGMPIRLVGDPSQDRRDRYGRLLAYVELLRHTGSRPGDDLADVLLSMGYGKVYVYKRSFARIRDYKSSEETAKRQYRGLWAACQPTTTTTTTTTSTTTATTITTTATTTTADRSGCDASYPTVCIPPPPPDLDCAEIRFTEFRVDWSMPNPDPHRFDGDHDGIGCET